MYPSMTLPDCLVDRFARHQRQYYNYDVMNEMAICYISKPGMVDSKTILLNVGSIFFIFKGIFSCKLNVIR